MDPLLYEKVNLDPSEKISLQSGLKVIGQKTDCVEFEKKIS